MQSRICVSWVLSSKREIVEARCLGISWLASVRRAALVMLPSRDALMSLVSGAAAVTVFALITHRRRHRREEGEIPQQGMTDSSRLEALPTDVLAKVLSSCAPQELGRLCAVSRNFAAPTTADELWRPLVPGLTNTQFLDAVPDSHCSAIHREAYCTGTLDAWRVGWKERYRLLWECENPLDIDRLHVKQLQQSYALALDVLEVFSCWSFGSKGAPAAEVQFLLPGGTTCGVRFMCYFDAPLRMPNGEDVQHPSMLEQAQHGRREVADDMWRDGRYNEDRRIPVALQLFMRRLSDGRASHVLSLVPFELDNWRHREHGHATEFIMRCSPPKCALDASTENPRARHKGVAWLAHGVFSNDMTSLELTLYDFTAKVGLLDDSVDTLWHLVTTGAQDFVSWAAMAELLESDGLLTWVKTNRPR